MLYLSERVVGCPNKINKINNKMSIIIILSLFMSWGIGLSYGLHIRRTCPTPHGPSADWRVLTTANVARINGLKCIPKHGGVEINFWSPI
jgi:hypothetical protein